MIEACLTVTEPHAAVARRRQMAVRARQSSRPWLGPGCCGFPAAIRIGIGRFAMAVRSACSRAGGSPSGPDGRRAASASVTNCARRTSSHCGISRGIAALPQPQDAAHRRHQRQTARLRPTDIALPLAGTSLLRLQPSPILRPLRQARGGGPGLISWMLPAPTFR